MRYGGMRDSPSDSTSLGLFVLVHGLFLAHSI